MLKESGDYILDDMTQISLTKDKRLFLDIADAEPLIQKGIVEQIV